MTTSSSTTTFTAISESSNLGSAPSEERLTAASSHSSSRVRSLAALWAMKYVKSLDEPLSQEVRSSRDRLWLPDQVAARLESTLNRASAQAWSQTETLLAEEVERHHILPELIDPWQISFDTRSLFQQAIEACRDQVSPQRLSVLSGPTCGDLRDKYTAEDPRVIGFVSMQFHYTGQYLLQQLPLHARPAVEAYFKVLDDHMYMPLRAAYQAAGRFPLNSPILKAVQHLLPVSTDIAHAVCEHVSRSHPRYSSYSGLLSARTVRTSSIRDVEMFQVYLCLCVLENSIRSVKRELFPLCVMLYPRLQVQWKLVQEMLYTLGWEMHDRLLPHDTAIFLPYLKTLVEMFSIFQEADAWALS